MIGMKTFLKLLGTVAAGTVITVASLALGYSLYNQAPTELPQVYADAVSYTHLDVYKRQLLTCIK